MTTIAQKKRNWKLFLIYFFLLISLIPSPHMPFKSLLEPNANTLSDTSAYLILDDEFAEIACLDDEIWGIIFHNRSIAQVSPDTGEYIQVLGNYSHSLTGLAVSNDFLYVTHYDLVDNNTVMVIDKSTGLIIDTFEVGSVPFTNWAMEYDQGYLWLDVEISTKQSLLKVDATNGEIIKNFSVSDRICAGPRIGDIIYAIAYDSDSLVGYDAATGVKIMSIPLFSGLTGDWGIAQKNDYLVFSNYDTNNLYFIRAKYATGETVYRYNLETTLPDAYRLACNDTHLFVRPSYSTSIKVIELSTGSVVKTLSLSFVPWGMVYYDQYLWVTEITTPGKIHKIAMDGTDVASFTPDASGHAYIPGIATDGTYLWISFDNKTIAKIQMSTQTIVEQFTLETHVSALAYNADLDELFAISDNDDNIIYRINLDSQSIDRLNSISVNVIFPGGLSIWRDKIIIIGDMYSKRQLIFTQYNLESFSDEIPSDNSTTPLKLFGFNAYYVLGGAGGGGLIIGVVLGAILFSKKKKKR